MFPVSFADRVVREYTDEGDGVLDPFAGRGTAVFSAATQGRHGIGIELNPVGWVYARAKLGPAEREQVESRLKELKPLASKCLSGAEALPEFFHHCFTRDVRKFLLAARAHLDWRRSIVDRTVMALLLVHLHGKREASLSNQMRQTKSMSPDYAVRWWKEHNSSPPDVDPVEFVLKKLDWRYAKGTPETADSCVYLGDSTRRLGDVRALVRERRFLRPKLLFTSPPYCGITNYHYDQWLRLWLLGGAPNARRVGGRHRARFDDREQYGKLLRTVFLKAKELLHPDAAVYVRTDRREVTYKATRAALIDVFPKKTIKRVAKPFERPTQTRLFGDHSEKEGEVDLILLPK